jgi:putative (di)nucleoside polyphosphate hydrolase
MPQGGLDESEDPEAAARRELEEETGVTRARILGRTRQWYSYDLPAGLVGTAWHGRYRGQTQLWFAARFEGEDSEIDLEPKPGHEREFDVWRWVPHAQLPGLVVPFKRPVYEGVIREFEPFVRGS